MAVLRSATIGLVAFVSAGCSASDCSDPALLDAIVDREFDVVLDTTAWGRLTIGGVGFVTDDVPPSGTSGAVSGVAAVTGDENAGYEALVSLRDGSIVRFQSSSCE